jgi:hypothetical protein
MRNKKQTKKVKAKNKAKKTSGSSRKKQISKVKISTRAKVLKKAVSKIEKQPVFAVVTAPVAKEQEIIQAPIKEIIKPELKTPVIKVQNTRLSKHVLDLKKPIAPKNDLPTEHEEKMYQQIFTEYKNKERGVIKQVNQFKSSLKKTLTLPKKQEKSIQIKTKHQVIQSKPETKAIAKMPEIEEIYSEPKSSSAPLKLDRLIFPAYLVKTLSAFVIICFLIIAPFLAFNYYQHLQGKETAVLEQASQALLHLAISQKAASAKDLPNTQSQLEQSAANFNQAKIELDDVNVLVKSLISILPETNKQFTTATNLMTVGEKLSSSAAVLTEALEQIKINNSLSDLNLTDNLKILKDHLDLVMPDLQSASQDLDGISVEELPAEYQDKVVLLKSSVPQIVNNLGYFNSASDLLLKLLGETSKKRYLILFQNNNEIRPTGGFIGSYALVDIDRGNVTKINIPGGGPYDLKAGLNAEIESPLPLHIVNARWEFQDANWFADVPSSAEKLSYLFEKSGGPTFDGIIFINATLIEQLLAITGPIDLPEYNLQINQTNFINTVQKEVEINYDREENKPKQIIADLTPLLIDRLLQSDNQKIMDLLNTFLTALNQKEIQFYFTDFDLETFVNQNNWGGKLKETESDYLDIVSTNIAGEKTDAKIKQTAILNVEIQDDGSIINTLTITKTHNGLAGEAFYGVPNLDYLRIYVPKDSELIKAEGFYQIPPEFFILPNYNHYSKDADISFIEANKNIDPESGTEILSEGSKTFFANWIMVEPGQSQTITISYKLPFKLDLKSKENTNGLWQTIKGNLGLDQELYPEFQTYSLIWQKQSGKRNFNIHVSIDFPKPLNYQYIYPSYMQKSDQAFGYTTELDSDKLLGIIFKP